MKKLIVVALLVMLFLAGCATPGSRGCPGMSALFTYQGMSCFNGQMIPTGYPAGGYYNPGYGHGHRH